MKRLLAGLGVAAGIVGCVGSAVPVPEVDARMAEVSGHSVAELRRGRGVYLTHCGRCHEYVRPEQVKVSDWKLVVPGMCWNAGVGKADGEAVLAYILAVKGQGGGRN